MFTPPLGHQWTLTLTSVDSGVQIIALFRVRPKTDHLAIAEVESETSSRGCAARVAGHDADT
jgi:hypothetical protein